MASKPMVIGFALYTFFYQNKKRINLSNRFL